MKVSRTLFPIAALLLASCSADRYSLEGQTESGYASEVNVLGKEPRIQVKNKGPAELRVEFDSPDDSRDESLILGVESVVRTMLGPVRVRLTPIGSDRATWRVESHRSDGLAADLILEDSAGSAGER